MLIHEAAKKQDMNTILKLVNEQGIEYAKSKDLYQNNVLHIACEKGYDSVFDYALQQKIDVNACNVGGDTPLILSCKRGAIKYIEKLLEHGADGILF